MSRAVRPVLKPRFAQQPDSDSCRAVGIAIPKSVFRFFALQLLLGSMGLSAGYCQQPVTLAVARDRANVLQHVYLSTQDVMHRRYFHGGKSAVPARVMEDVFSEMNRKLGVQANWISVTLKAMSINHEPETEFEKQAARALKSGKVEFESVEPSHYRRAIAVPLTGGCIHCHAGLVSRPPAKPVAGLVISIPIGEQPESGVASESAPD